MKNTNTTKRKPGVKATLLRQMLAPSLAASLSSFVFFNQGTVKEFKGSRVCVAWPGVGKLWFDEEALLFWKS